MKGIFSYGSKFFPVRMDPNYEEDKTDIGRVASLESVLFTLSHRFLLIFIYLLGVSKFHCPIFHAASYCSSLVSGGREV